MSSSETRASNLSCTSGDGPVVDERTDFFQKEFQQRTHRHVPDRLFHVLTEVALEEAIASWRASLSSSMVRAIFLQCSTVEQGVRDTSVPQATLVDDLASFRCHP
jgi:hypothetical protein